MGLISKLREMKQESEARKAQWKRELAIERGEVEESLEEMIERYKNVEEKGLQEKDVDLMDLNGNKWIDAFEFDDDQKDYKWHVW